MNFHAPAALLMQKTPPYPLDRGLGWLQSRSGRSGEERKIPAPAGIKTRSIIP
jgi:hypothetical protein